MNYIKIKSFVILPHWCIEGGAGFYIRDLIASLRPVVNVKVAGPYAGDYDETPIRYAYLDKLTLQSLPTYQGIRLAQVCYHILISGLRAIAFLSTPRNNRFKCKFDALVLTSSVQALAVPLARRLFPDSRTVIVVQENVCLSRGLGRLTRFLLKRADVVVSITDTWAQHARENGLDSVVLPNSFDPDYAAPANNRDPAIESDLLYVGGGATIKGFDNMIAALPTLLKVPGRRIFCLGHYSKAALKMLERIREGAHPDAQLNIVGLVPDIRPYLRGTRLLVLPIGSPHFCRPAIEAGLFAKTFVIPDHEGLEGFSFDNINCKLYKKDDINQFIEIASKLIEKPTVLYILGQANRVFAQQFLVSRKDRIRHLIKFIIKKND